VRKADSSRDTTFWPDQILKDGVASLAVLATVMFLVFLPALQGKDYLGAELGAPADPTEPYAAARPEWYFLFLFQLLKYFPGETEIIGAHVIPGAVLLLMFLMPFIGRWQLGHRFNVLFMFVLMGAIGFLTWQAIDQDVNDPLYLAASQEAQEIAERVPLLAQEHGISTEGAVALVRSDPFIQGPKIFAKQCAGCHRYDGHDGTGRVPKEEATAADLGNFGSPDWMRAVLTDYRTVFAPLKNAVWQGENVGDKFLEGDMADWSEENAEALTKAENQESLDALLAFMVAQAQRDDLPQPDSERVEQGKEVFEFGDLADGNALSSACADCHAMHAVGDDDELALDSGLAPSLTGYGSAAWLADFIAHPEQHYGSKNAMPPFAERLTTREMDLLVRWMTGDYLKPRKHAE
jgi:ubiquinol-cytochrome c reductase cytochrome b subunit